MKASFLLCCCMVGILVTVTVADHDDCTSTDCKARCYSKHYMTGYCVNRGISIDICYCTNRCNDYHMDGKIAGDRCRTLCRNKPGGYSTGTCSHNDGLCHCAS